MTRQVDGHEPTALDVEFAGEATPAQRVLGEAVQEDHGGTAVGHGR